MGYSDWLRDVAVGGGEGNYFLGFGFGKAFELDIDGAAFGGYFDGFAGYFYQFVFLFHAQFVKGGFDSFEIRIVADDSYNWDAGVFV